MLFHQRRLFIRVPIEKSFSSNFLNHFSLGNFLMLALLAALWSGNCESWALDLKVQKLPRAFPQLINRRRKIEKKFIDERDKFDKKSKKSANFFNHSAAAVYQSFDIYG